MDMLLFSMPTWITSGATTTATSRCHDLHTWRSALNDVTTDPPKDS